MPSIVTTLTFLAPVKPDHPIHQLSLPWTSLPLVGSREAQRMRALPRPHRLKLSLPCRWSGAGAAELGVGTAGLVQGGDRDIPGAQ